MKTPVPDLRDRRPPRCPPFVEVKESRDLVPYIESVARRPYSAGLHAAWGLRPGERVSVRVDNWHDPICVEAVVAVLEKFGCKYEVVRRDRGPVPTRHGHDEVDYYFMRTKELAGWMEDWEELDRKAEWDLILQGFGGAVLTERNIRIQRLPFISPEMTASLAHMIPFEILQAIDQKTWDAVRLSRKVRITDPEGTDVSFTQRDEYYEPDRSVFSDHYISQWFPQNKPFARSYEPGHIWGRPWFFTTRGEDGEGTIAGTMNHIGPYPRIEMTLENSKIVDVREGGQFGDDLRRVMKETADLEYPGFPGKGLLYWWEAAIGTNPKIHRPRANYLSGWVNGLFERLRSGIVHIGFGTVVSSHLEVVAARMGLPAGHFHVHLNFPTVMLEMLDGSTLKLIDEGRLTILDDPEVRSIASKYGDPDEWLQEDWIPAVPGLNVDGDYWTDYADDPEDWTLTELRICRKWHPLFMKMIRNDSASAALGSHATHHTHLAH
jgi:hypothetical protein